MKLIVKATKRILFDKCPFFIAATIIHAVKIPRTKLKVASDSLLVSAHPRLEEQVHIVTKENQKQADERVVVAENVLPFMISNTPDINWPKPPYQNPIRVAASIC